MAKNHLLLTLLILTTTLSVAMSEESSVSEDYQFQILVSATRIEEKMTILPSKAAVITEKEIESMPATTAADVIEIAEGVELTRQGGAGSLSGARLWGARSEHTLVLLDGRPINTLDNGVAQLEHIPVSIIKRVEIIKGGMSDLWGANAVGGVINIITKDPDVAKKVEFEASVGSHNDYQYNFSHSLTVGKFAYILSGNMSTNQGYRNNDDYKEGNLFLKMNYHPSNNFQNSLNFGFYRDELGVPGVDPNDENIPKYGNKDVYSLFDRQNTSFGFFNYDTKILLSSGNDQSTIYMKLFYEDRLYRFKTKYDYYDENWNAYPALEKDRYLTNTYGANIQFAIHPSQKNTFSLGFDSLYGKHKTKSRIEYTDNENNEVQHLDNWKASVSQYGIWARDAHHFNHWIELSLGLRYDDHSDFPSALSPKAGLTISPTEKLSFILEGGRAFRAPTINHLFWPVQGRTTPRDIHPEKSSFLSFGISTRPYNTVSLGLNLFYRDINDMIVWAPTPEDPWIWEPRNCNKNITKGLEFKNELLPFSWLNFKSSYTYLDATQKELENGIMVKRQAAYTPVHQAKFSTTISLDNGFCCSVQGIYTSEKFAYMDNWTTMQKEKKCLDPYFLLNLKLSQTIGNYVQVFFEVRNALNEHYATQFGFGLDDQDYPMPGREFRGGMKLSF